MVRHVLKILDALAAGEVGDGVSQCSISFLALLRQHEAMGDLSYASPEQARGETLDERSLVFSVGVLLFEELTGRHPFGKETARRFARIKKGEMGSGVQYFPQVPTELRSVLVQAMGPFPEERFASLAELRQRAGGVSSPPRRAARSRTAPSLSPAGDVRARHPSAGGRLLSDAAGDRSLAAQPSPPPLPRSRPIAGPLLATPLMPPVPERRGQRLRAVAERAGWLVLGVLATVGARVRLPAVEPRRLSRGGGGAAPEPSRRDPLRGARRRRRWWCKQTPRLRRRRCRRRTRRRRRRANASSASTTRSPSAPACCSPPATPHRSLSRPDELSPEARRCLRKTLLGVSAGAAPDKSIIVEVRFKLRPDGSDDVRVLK